LEYVENPDKTDYIDWESGREAYHDVRTPVAYAPLHKPAPKPPEKSHWLSIRGEESFGSLIAAAGAIWTVYTATQDITTLWQFQIAPPGPLEVCGLGIVVWLHAKWRRSTNAR
jgi:hypothetical protein